MNKGVTDKQAKIVEAAVEFAAETRDELGRAIGKPHGTVTQILETSFIRFAARVEEIIGMMR